MKFITNVPQSHAYAQMDIIDAMRGRFNKIARPVPELVRGPPLATEAFSTKELASRGMCGIYEAPAARTGLDFSAGQSYIS